MASGLPVFMAEVPEYEVRAGRMHVTLGEFEIVLPLPIFQEGARRAQRAIDDWFESQTRKVVPIKKRPRH